MRKRYVFWRTPHGSVDKNSMQRPSAILAEIGRTSEIKGAEIQWKGFNLRRLQTTLRAALIVRGPDEQDLNETDSWNLIWGALRSLLRKRRIEGQPVTSNEFIKEADLQAADFFRKPALQYTLATSLSVDSLPAKVVTIGGCVLKAVHSREKRFPFPQALEHHEVYRAFKKHVEHSKYKQVGLRTVGRSIHEATDKALSSLTLLRGLWTLFSTYGSWSISFGFKEPKPLGVIRTGPIHTLHGVDQPISDIYWYEPEYVEDDKPFKPTKGWKTIEKNRRWAMRKLNSSPFRRDLEDLIRRYALALDQLNLDVAFLHLWSILEKVTNTVGTQYDKTIDRAVWTYTDRNIAAETLESLRLYRNRFVHVARSTDERDQIVYLVKSFVEPHLLHLMDNHFEVQSIEEYAQILSLPTKLDVLRRQRRSLSRAIKIVQRMAKEDKEQL